MADSTNNTITNIRTTINAEDRTKEEKSENNVEQKEKKEEVKEDGKKEDKSKEQQKIPEIGFDVGTVEKVMGRTIFSLPEREPERMAITLPIDIKYNLLVHESAGDYENSFMDRKGYLNVGRNLFQVGWIRIDDDTARFRARAIERAFCINAPHKSKMRNKFDPTYLREGNGFTCYIIEDVSYLSKNKRIPKSETDVDNINLNIDMDDDEKRKTISDAVKSSGGTPSTEELRRTLTMHTKLIRSYKRMVIDDSVPAAGYYLFDNLKMYVENYENKKTSIMCMDSVSLEFDYRAAMYNIGFAEAKMFSDDLFEFTRVFNRIPEVNKISKDFHQFGKGEFLATLNIHSGIYAAINLRILTASGIDSIYLHGIEIATTGDNINTNDVLRALQYLKNSIRYTARALNCEVEHEIAYCQGLHSAWHLHSHTDEGGWIRKVHSYVKYPSSHGYLRCDPGNATQRYRMEGTWLEEKGKEILDKYLCFAYCSVMADPGMEINGCQLPTIALRSDFGDKTGDVSYEQFKDVVIDGNRDNIKGEACANDFNQILRTINNWMINLKYLYATCQNITCGASDPTATLQRKVLSIKFKHLSRKSHVLPYSWVEISGISMYRHMECVVKSVYNIFDSTYMNFFDNTIDIGFLTQKYREYGLMTPKDSIIFRLGKHSPRFCGAHYIMNSAYHTSDGLSSMKYVPLNPQGQDNHIKNKIIFASNDWSNCAGMRWVLPHTTIPHQCEGTVFVDDVQIRYIHQQECGQLPSIKSFMDLGIYIQIIGAPLENVYVDIGSTKKNPTYTPEALWNVLRRSNELSTLQESDSEISSVQWGNIYGDTYKERPNYAKDIISIGKHTQLIEPVEGEYLRAVHYTKGDQLSEINRLSDIKKLSKTEQTIAKGLENITTSTKPASHPQNILSDKLGYELANRKVAWQGGGLAVIREGEEGTVGGPNLNTKRDSATSEETFYSATNNDPSTMGIYIPSLVGATIHKPAPSTQIKTKMKGDEVINEREQCTKIDVEDKITDTKEEKEAAQPKEWIVSPDVLTKTLMDIKQVRKSKKGRFTDNQHKNMRDLKEYIISMYEGMSNNDFSNFKNKFSYNAVDKYAGFVRDSGFHDIKLGGLSKLVGVRQDSIIKSLEEVGDSKKEHSRPFNKRTQSQ